MTGVNATIARLGMPPRIAALPVSPAGFPIPFFVCKDPLDFRVIAPGALAACHNGQRCWVCGQPRGRTFAFVAGPMCAASRTSAEPPSHRECAEWSAKACPFLTKPKMRRNERDMPPEVHVAGHMIARNPGVSVVWVCRDYKPFKAGSGYLFTMGEPLELLWYAEGRPATRAEAEASFGSGLPLLEQACEQEATPREVEQAKAELALRCAWVAERMPAA